MDEQTQIPVNETIELEAPVQNTLFSLEEFTVNTAKTLESLQKALKAAGDMLNESLRQNQAFMEIEEKVKETQKTKKEIKTNLLQRGDLIVLAEKIKKTREEIKEAKNSQSDYAIEYSRLSGKDELVKDGVTYDIVKVAHLVKRVQ